MAPLTALLRNDTPLNLPPFTEEQTKALTRYVNGCCRPRSWHFPVWRVNIFSIPSLRDATGLLSTTDAAGWFYYPTGVLVALFDSSGEKLLDDREGMSRHCLGSCSSPPIPGKAEVHRGDRPSSPTLGHESLRRPGATGTVATLSCGV
jgi:hypothetical protein